VKGTKYGTSNASIKASVDADSWQVKKITGTIESGFGFTLERIA